MKNRLLPLLLCALLALCPLAAQALVPDPDVYPNLAMPYGLEGHRGMLFAVYPQPNGDLIVMATGLPVDVDYDVDHTNARITPEGDIVWAHHVPYVSEEGASHLFPLSNGHYASSLWMPDEDASVLYLYDPLTGHYFDGEPLYAAGFSAWGDQIIGTRSPTGTKSRTITHLTNDGALLKTRKTTYDRVPGYINAARYDDYEIQLMHYNNEEHIFSLRCEDIDGGVLWEKEYASPLGHINYMAADGAGGAYLMCDPGLYHDTNHVMRVDGEGKLLWDVYLPHGEAIVRDIAVDAEGWQLLWQTDDTLQFVTITPEGEIARHPSFYKPYYGDNSIVLHALGLFTVANGTTYLYGSVERSDYSEYYGLTLVPLDTLTDSTGQPSFFQ